MTWKKHIKGNISYSYGNCLFSLASLKQIADDNYDLKEQYVSTYEITNAAKNMFENNVFKHDPHLLHIGISNDGTKKIKDGFVKLKAYQKIIQDTPSKGMLKVMVLYEKDNTQQSQTKVPQEPKAPATPATERVTTRSSGIREAVKSSCWKRWNGNLGVAKCFVCQDTEIRMDSFHAGHITARSVGGADTVQNLIPICSKCNQSMGAQNLYDFKRQNFPDTPWPEPNPNYEGGGNVQNNEPYISPPRLRSRSPRPYSFSSPNRPSSPPVRDPSPSRSPSPKKKPVYSSSYSSLSNSSSSSSSSNEPTGNMNAWINKLWKFVEDECSGMISNAKNPQRPNFNEQHFKQCLRSLNDKKDYKCYKDLYNAFEDVNRRLKTRKVSKEFAKDYPDKWKKCLDYQCFIGLVDNFCDDMYYVDTQYEP